MSQHLEGQQLQHACAEWDNLARLAQGDLRGELREIAIRLGLYHFKDRLKGVGEIYKKVIRNREREARLALNSDFYNPSNVPDAWGVRYVTLLQDEIMETFEEVLHYLSHGRGRNRKVSIKRLTHYSNRGERDVLSLKSMLHRYLKDVQTQQPGVAAPEIREFESKETGYSALHLELAYEKLYDFGLGPIDYKIPFEIQIRDIFEEGWGEISHRFDYKPRQEPRLIAQARQRASKRHELSALKASADAVSQHAALLDRSYTYYVDALSQGLSWHAASDIEKDMTTILEALEGAQGTVHGKIRSAYDMMRAAEVSYVRDIDNKLFRVFYENASASFYEAIDEIKNVDPSLLNQLGRELKGSNRESGRSLHGMTVGYHLMVEYGNALVRSVPPYANANKDAGAREKLDKAIGAYNELLNWGEPHPDCTRNAILALRLGQAVKRRHLTSQDGLRAAAAKLNEARNFAVHDQHVRSHMADRWLMVQAAYDILWCDYHVARLSAISPGNRVPDAEPFVRNLESVIDSANVLIRDANQLFVDTGSHLHLSHKCMSVALKMMTDYYKNVRKVNAARARDQLPTLGNPRINDGDLRTIIETLRHRPYNRLIETTTETIGSILDAAVVLNDDDLALLMAEKNFQKLTDIARARLAAEPAAGERRTVKEILDADQWRLYRAAQRVNHRDPDEGFIEDDDSSLEALI